jgi:lysophospholipase L1-like esterase
MNIESKNRIPRRVLGAVYLSLSTLAILLAIEVGARIFIDVSIEPASWVAGPTSEAYKGFDWSQQYFEDLQAPGGGFVYSPFSLWRHVDKTSELINVKDGYRVSWEPEPQPNIPEFAIYLFGGSTAFCLGSPDDLTLASLLAKKLEAADDTRRYVVKNFGVSAFTSDNELHLLVDLLQRGERPDAAVFYDGLNDTQIKVSVEQEHFFAAGFNENLFKPLRMRWREVARQVAYRSHLVWYLTGYRQELRRTKPDPSSPETLRRRAAAMLDDYAATMRIVAALGNEYGFRTRHFWQPSRYNTAKILTEEERSHPTTNEVRLAHERTAEIAAETNFFERTGVVDIHSSLDAVREGIFLDAGHINPTGNAAVASAMLAPVLEMSLEQ